MSAKAKRYQLTTTLYGTRRISRDQLYQLHREVTRAASLARREDPDYMERYEAGQRLGSREVQKWWELWRFRRDHENAATTSGPAA